MQISLITWSMTLKSPSLLWIMLGIFSWPDFVWKFWALREKTVGALSGLDWNGPLNIIQSNFPEVRRDTFHRPGCLKPCATWPWMFLGLEHLLPLWSTCARVSPPTPCKFFKSNSTRGIWTPLLWRYFSETDLRGYFALFFPL